MYYTPNYEINHSITVTMGILIITSIIAFDTGYSKNIDLKLRQIQLFALASEFELKLKLV